MTGPDDDPFFASTAGSASAPVAKDPAKRTRPLRPSARRFILGWLVAPALVVASLVLTGVHYGARNADAWYTGIIRWLASLD